MKCDGKTGFGDQLLYQFGVQFMLCTPDYTDSADFNIYKI